MFHLSQRAKEPKATRRSLSQDRTSEGTSVLEMQRGNRKVQGRCGLDASSECVPGPRVRHEGTVKHRELITEDEADRRVATVNHLEERYLAWRGANPKIMDLYRKFAKEAVDHGKRFSISLLTERVRWESTIKKRGVYKVDNNFRAYIARDLVREMPLLSNFIETRRVMGEA